MSVDEYLLFIPLLIYGIVLSRLLGEWKRFFDIANWHAPYIITIVVFTEISIWNTYSFLRIFEGRQGDDYLTYVSLLVGPFLLLLAVNALLQDEDRDGVVDRSEFASRMRPSFFLMGLFVALHLLPGYRDDDGELAIVRLPALALVWSIAFFRRDWLIYGLGVVWVVGLVRRIQLGL